MGPSDVSVAKSLDMSPSLLSRAVISPVTKIDLGREGFITATGHSPSWKAVGEGAGAETTEEFCSLACSLWRAEFSYTIQSRMPRDGTAHRGMDPPTPTHKIKTVPSP